MHYYYSVVIPHYNQTEPLSDCIEALGKQSFNSNRFEIIIVDNGTPDFVLFKKQINYPKITWLTNNENRNPYTSRNIGIKSAKGEIICFLDSSCVPHVDWLIEIDKSIQQTDILAGRFDIVPYDDSISSLAHGILYLNNEKNVLNDYGVPAGNLIIRKNVFYQIGLFKDENVSGNDIEWTKRALSQGYNIRYCKQCLVLYPGNSYRQLLTKMKKYASGVLAQKESISLSEHFKGLLPLKLSTFNTALSYRSLNNLTVFNKIYLFLIVWNAKLYYSLKLMK